MNEEAVLFGKSQSLVGIITEPPTGLRDSGKPAIILLNAGFIHRVGPNRLYVHLARRLAAHGFLSVRFDHSGIGDSIRRTDTRGYEESYLSEAQEVMDWLTRHYGLDSFCFMGLCSGARTSFYTSCRDPRVVGAVLLNAKGLAGSMEWIRYVESRWQMKELFFRLFTIEGIWKTITGRAPYLRMLNIARHRLKNLFKGNGNTLSTGNTGASEISQNLHVLLERSGFLLWISSEWDSSREYFRLLARDMVKSERFHELVEHFTIPEANHTFDTLPAQKQVLDTIESWALRRLSQTSMTQRDLRMSNERA